LLIIPPIENAINSATDVQTLRSRSIQGLSVATVFFDPSGDICHDHQVVADRLAVAAQQLTTVLVGEAALPDGSASVADLTIRLRLLSVPGIAKSLCMAATYARSPSQPVRTGDMESHSGSPCHNRHRRATLPRAGSPDRIR
jgi:hypothetical protein